jgi:deoxyribodipyrimidine photolyase-related protein
MLQVAIHRMASTTLILFPNQLFETTLLPSRSVSRIILVDPPCMSGMRQGSDTGVDRLHLNKLRLVYQRVCFKRYERYLRGALPKTVDIQYVDMDAADGFLKGLEGEITVFDPEDSLLMRKLPKDVKVLDSPSFLMSKEDLEAFVTKRKKGSTRFQHHVFYEWVKDRLGGGLLSGVKSMDKDNRKPYPKNAPPPPAVFPVGAKGASSRRRSSGRNGKDWLEAIQWVQKHPVFSKNPGPSSVVGLENAVLERLVNFPTTVRESKAWFKRFLFERFDNFGTYEDAIVKGQPWMYHSVCSMLLNNGLLTPRIVVEETTRYYNKHKKVIGINHYEGFLRQVIGWREYCRLYYRYIPPSVYRRNVFKARGRLDETWYTGTTPVPVVNDAIRDAFDTGYLHHIRRLMVMSNYMMLREIHPDEVFRWMYEFSLDSWEWVMVFNCYSMGTWSDGGSAMRKPYISSSGYIRRMARGYEGDGKEWIKHWDTLFDRFVRKHADILKRTQLANLVPKSV